jgi:cell division septum initiation protein DivIVA
MATELDQVERLRARVDQLERELAERTARAEAAVAAAQDRSYRVDRILAAPIRALRAVKRRLR